MKYHVSTPLQETHSRFLEFEADLSLFDKRIHGFPIWERIRHHIQRELIRDLGIFAQRTHVSSTISTFGQILERLEVLSSFGKNLVWRNPLFAGEHDVAFFSMPRRKQTKSGSWEDIFCDPVHQTLSLDYVQFDAQNTEGGHKSPAVTDNLRYLDLFESSYRLRQKLGMIQNSDLSSSDRQWIRTVEAELADRFDVQIDVERWVRATVNRRSAVKPLYERVLKQVSPSVVFLVVSYGNETLVEVCRELGIPTAELQHGIICPSNPGYGYPDDRQKRDFPDYLFTWGEYWESSTALPIPSDQVVTTGYPYHESERDRYAGTLKREQIVFISQGALGDRLSTIAAEVSTEVDGADIIYKLHPGEYGEWQSQYPQLVENDITVVEDDIPLYQIFAESSIQVGVSSTAIFEGLTFDLRTIIIDLPRVDPIGYLEKTGRATVVSSSSELVAEIDKFQISSVSHDTEEFFKSDTKDRLNTIISSLFDLDV